MQAEAVALDGALEETVLATERVYEGRLLKIDRLTVRLPNGRTSTRERIAHPGASAMVALDTDGTIVMERQWRAPAGKAFWEIPAGKIDPGETPAQAARRELTEEAGLTASRWTHLGTLHNAIGYSNEHIEVYLAQDLARADQSLDDNEFLSLVRVPWRKALEMTLTGDVTDVKTITALFWLEKFLEGKLAGTPA